MKERERARCYQCGESLGLPICEGCLNRELKAMGEVEAKESLLQMGRCLSREYDRWSALSRDL